MSTYRNGDIPNHLLIRRGNFLLTAGTWAKWDALVTDVLARHRVRLHITDGLGVMRGTGAYRTRIMQRNVKRHFVSIGQGHMAAAEGTSSHGGEFNGKDALAIDVNNYGRIPLAEFFAAARRAGFEPGYFDGRRGPYEPWHLIDWNPYRKVAAPAGNTKPIPVTEPEEDEDDDMYKPTVHVRTEGGYECALAHPEIGPDLAQHTGPGTGGKRTAGKVTTYRGFMVTSDQEIGLAWSRLHAKGSGGETSRTDRAGYIAIQIEASRIAVEFTKNA